MKNILLLGSGGREHALAWKLKQSEKLNRLFIAPGNAGTAQLGENVSLEVTDFEGIKRFVTKNDIDMVVVGPEDPLVRGIYNFLRDDAITQHVAVIGPSKEAAQLEGSKDFAKRFMAQHNIPTARYKSISKDSINEGFHFLETLTAPYVLKADGLAAGKGVLILSDLQEAKDKLSKMLGGMFGAASQTVVIEEFLSGIECSVFVLTDGKSYVLLPEAKDYKRVGEGDTGLNTGGMGAISPVAFADEVFMKKVEERVIQPTIAGLRHDGLDYKGFIFFGLISVDGEPMVIEYNVRLGDPETEVVLPRLTSDLVDLFQAVADGTLNGCDVQFDSRFATTVMLVSGGYPEAYEKGKKITGLNSVSDSLVFHAGTACANSGVVTSGGRVLAVTSYGDSMRDALDVSYKNAERIQFDGKYFRKDIGFDL